MTTPRARATFPRSVRIRAKRDFDRVFARRLRVSDRWITLLAHRGPSSQARLGIAVGKVVGPAVTRNRRKRLVREAFRGMRHELPAGSEWVIIIHSGPEPTVEQLRQSIRTLSGQLMGKLRIEN